MSGNTAGIKKLSLLRGVVLSFLLVLCGGSRAAAEAFTIGMITNVRIHVQTMEGFKAGMAELGYVEGRDVKYFFTCVPEGDAARLDAEIQTILAKNVDLFLTIANEVSMRVKESLEGIDIPILIAGSSRPVEEGLVDSLGRPGGNITGVRMADNFAKTLEWLTTLLPDTKKVWVPYNPDEVVSVISMRGLDSDAAKMGIELVCQSVRSVEETVVLIEKLPEDIDAIYRIPSPLLDSRNSELSQAAIAHGIPMVACLPLDEAVLMTFSADLFEAGKQTARLAHLIWRGAAPSDLPIETCDASLTINLDTAEKIGIYVPDEILLQAESIIRR